VNIKNDRFNPAGKDLFEIRISAKKFDVRHAGLEIIKVAPEANIDGQRAYYMKRAGYLHLSNVDRME
jgi:hypothetical protein